MGKIEVFPPQKSSESQWLEESISFWGDPIFSGVIFC